MNLHRKWAVAVGTVLVTGALISGAALAQSSGDPPAATAPRQAAAESAGLKEVRQNLRTLHQSYMEKFKAEAQGLIDQAVRDGTITPAEADRLKQGKPGFHRGPGGFKRHFHGGPRGGFHGFGALFTREEIQARLDAAVKAGKLTQAQADRILLHWEQHHQKANQ